MNYFGNLYYGDLEEAIEHYKNKYGKKPTVIYCNKDEMKNTKLERKTSMRFPKNNYVLTHKEEE